MVQHLIEKAWDPAPEVFVDAFEARLLPRQRPSAEDGLQVNPAPLDGVQIQQILIQV